MKNIVIAMTTVLMASSSAWGARSDRDSNRGRLDSQVEVIRLQGRQFQGENIIQIKQELKRMGIRMQNKAVRSVTVVAKSRQGRGRATLLVGRNHSQAVRVGLDRRADRHDDRRSLRRLFNEKGGMNRVTLSSPVGVRRQLNNGTGRIQVRLNGNIRVARIKVELVSERRRHHGNKPKPRKRSDEEVVIDLIGSVIGGVIENERNKKRKKRKGKD